VTVPELRPIRTLRDRADPKRTLAERIADRVASALGTTAFLVMNFAWIAAWYRFSTDATLLTMLISFEAIVLTIFVLIAQKRAARLNELRSELDLEINLRAEEELTKLLQIVTKLAEKQGVDLSKDRELANMISPTNLAEIERELHDQIAPSAERPEPPIR
jgi:uncharacterized membrane protein